MVIADIGEVVAGEERVFGHSLGFEMLYSDMQLNPYAHYFVLDIDKKVKGYIGVWIEDNAQIINLYVDESVQKMGFGSMLLDFVMNLCIMSRIPVLSLEVRPSNQKAITLYQKHGFVESHIRKNYYSNQEDAIVMIKTFEVEK
jgi:ribosomal-protein-alanine N-acetyltransferase